MAKELPAPPKSELARSKPQLQGRPLALPRPGKKEEAPLVPLEVRRPVALQAEPRPAPAPAGPPKLAAAVEEARSARPDPPPSGSLDGTAALSMDASDFPYTWYLRQILKKVEDTWTRQAKLTSPEEKPLIYVEIRRNGSIAAPKIRKSSGDTFYDRSALRAIRDASPFPPLPEEWPKSSLRVLFRFDLRLKG
ncbi:MAG: energy transducer TonB [Candidatus Methylomirabilia bacterium]